MKSQSRSTVESMWLLVAAVLDVAGDAAGLAAAQGDGDDPHLADVVDAGNGRAEVGGAGAGVELACRVESKIRTEASLGLTKSPRSGSRAISVLVIVSTIWTWEASVATAPCISRLKSSRMRCAARLPTIAPNRTRIARVSPAETPARRQRTGQLPGEAGRRGAQANP